MDTIERAVTEGGWDCVVQDAARGGVEGVRLDVHKFSGEFGGCLERDRDTTSMDAWP